MKMTMKAWLVPVLAIAAVCWGTTLAAQDKEEEGNPAAAAKAALSARVSLDRGLAASASHGRPISAKFEMDEGKLQLSVYTMKGGKFFEVSVDPNSGRVVKTEPIADGEDYTQNALRANAGFRAVSVTPSLKDGHAVAEVALAKGEEIKTVSVPL